MTKCTVYARVHDRIHTIEQYVRYATVVSTASTALHTRDTGFELEKNTMLSKSMIRKEALEFANRELQESLRNGKYADRLSRFTVDAELTSPETGGIVLHKRSTCAACVDCCDLLVSRIVHNTTILLLNCNL